MKKVNNWLTPQTHNSTVYETGLQLGDGLGHGEGGVGAGEHLEQSEECTDGECGVIKYTLYEQSRKRKKGDPIPTQTRRRWKKYKTRCQTQRQE